MLPQVLPMLAVAAEPFDSAEYSFEIKYDGVRALAAVEEGGWRLWGRVRTAQDCTKRAVPSPDPPAHQANCHTSACSPGRPDSSGEESQRIGCDAQVSSLFHISGLR